MWQLAAEVETRFTLAFHTGLDVVWDAPGPSVWAVEILEKFPTPAHKTVRSDGDEVRAAAAARAGGSTALLGKSSRGAVVSADSRGSSRLRRRSATDDAPRE